MRNDATIAPLTALALALAILLGFSFPAQAGKRYYCMAGTVALKSAAFDEAIEYLTGCIEEADLDDDQLVLVLIGRAFAYDEKGKFGKAIKDYNRAIEIEPNDPSSYVSRGTTLLKAGLRTLALDDFNRAIDLDPYGASAYFLRGLAKFELAQIVEAIADYDQAILLDPSDADFYVHRADAYAEISKYRTAISDYNRAIALDPFDAEIYTYRASIYFVTGDAARANADLERALELDPNILQR